MKEMVGGCCVCSDERGWPENPLVYCDGQNCTVAVHQACYGIVTVPSGPWYCRKCESQERSTRVRCELCPSRDGALKKTDNQGWAHVVCALYIPEVRFGNVTTMEPIILQLIPQERYAKTCYICQDVGKPSRATVGACMQCNKSNCKQQFHVTCAQSLGLLCEEAGNYLDNVKYCGYCQHHYSKLKKGGNVKIIPPYKPITHDTSSDSGSSPEKEIDSAMNATSSATSATSIKITTNVNTSTTSNVKQRKSTTVSKQSSVSSTPSSASASGASTTSNNAINLHGLNTVGSSGSSAISSSGTGGNIATNTSLSGGSSVSGSVGINNTTNLKNLSGSSSSYKDKDKHSKNINKVSSSNKDKDKESSSSSSSSSRESRDKSSKSKSKDFNSTQTSTTGNSGVSLMTSVSMAGSDSNSSGIALTQSATFSSTTGTASTSANTKDMAKSSSASANAGFTTDASSSNTDVLNFSSSAMDATATTLNSSTSGSSANATGSSSKINNNNSSTLNKKRKADSKTSGATTDEINTSLRDIIKDVSISLTALPQTDFEKEIEKSSKKQRTELSPPTHQTTTTEASTPSPSVTTVQVGGAATSTTTTTALATNSTSATISSHKQSGLIDSKGATNLSLNASGPTSVTTPLGHKTGIATTGNLKELQRDDRYGAQSTLAAHNVAVSQAALVSASNVAAANAPSLYVSVPLSTANVPGINLSTNTAAASTEHHSTPSQSTRAASQQQLLMSSAAQATAAAPALGGSGAAVSGIGIGGLMGRQSPRITHQSPAMSEHGSFPNNALNAAIHGVIQQNVKSPSPSLLNAGGNLTATTTESGNLKISYEKQTTRVTQLQEQETAPARRSRSVDTLSSALLYFGQRPSSLLHPIPEILVTNTV